MVSKGQDALFVGASLELPGGEASDVDVELVQAGIVTIAGELNLELHLVSFHRHAAHGTRRPNARPAPCAVRPTTRELAVQDDLTSDSSQDILVHPADPSAPRDAVRGKGEAKPEAAGSDA